MSEHTPYDDRCDQIANEVERVCAEALAEGTISDWHIERGDPDRGPDLVLTVRVSPLASMVEIHLGNSADGGIHP